MSYHGTMVEKNAIAFTFAKEGQKRLQKKFGARIGNHYEEEEITIVLDELCVACDDSNEFFDTRRGIAQMLRDNDVREDYYGNPANSEHTAQYAQRQRNGDHNYIPHTLLKFNPSPWRADRDNSKLIEEGVVPTNQRERNLLWDEIERLHMQRDEIQRKLDKAEALYAVADQLADHNNDNEEN